MRKTLREHQKQHKKDKYDDTQYSYTFDAARDLYTCITCDTECSTKEDIEKHVLTHKDHFSCEECNLFFDEPYKYATHIYKHNGADSYVCPLCISFKSRNRTSLLTHINTFHLQKFIYRCSKCGKGFNNCLQFKEHNNIHEGLRPFVCVVCGKGFPFSLYLHTHQVQNHKVSIEGVLGINQCHVCLKNYANSITLQRHLKKHHDEKKKVNEKNHLCDICGKGFARKDKLKVHYRVHTGVKPYSCSYCSKSFTKRDYLVMHERVHSGEKPYSCEYCGKCFNQGAPLRVHIRSHTGERPYVCHFCFSGFTSRGALNIHFKSCCGQQNI